MTLNEQIIKVLKSGKVKSWFRVLVSHVQGRNLVCTECHKQIYIETVNDIFDAYNDGWGAVGDELFCGSCSGDAGHFEGSDAVGQYCY